MTNGYVRGSYQKKKKNNNNENDVKTVPEVTK